ncbi:hypothetical protein HCTV-16_gp67 [Haloarcula virus HCTV-16]|nr:hypothetical protein HCTV-16_gp67 [Haloarcula virus HCTV-16]
MNVYDAADDAVESVRRAVKRAEENGHAAQSKTACAVARTRLETMLEDEERVNEAHGMVLERLDRKEIVAVR